MLIPRIDEDRVLLSADVRQIDGAGERFLDWGGREADNAEERSAPGGGLRRWQHEEGESMRESWFLLVRSTFPPRRAS